MTTKRSRRPRRTTPGAQLEAATPAPPPTAPPRRETIADAKKLLTDGKIDEAVQMFYRLRRAQPKSAAIALWLGHAYFRKLWRTDGLREYGAAIAASPAVKRDALLLRNVVVGLEDPTFRLARALIKKKIGNVALARAGRRVARDGAESRGCGRERLGFLHKSSRIHAFVAEIGYHRRP